jgi:signal transduction histidine kinase
MVKNIVENSGGTIWFETETGRGTTFYIRLPVYRPETVA